MVIDLILIVATGRWAVLARRSSRDRPQGGGYSVQGKDTSAKLLCTRADLLRYFDCQLQCRCRLRTRNARLASGACAFDERSELKFKRFAVFNLDSIARDLLSK